jgi:hypothetical protein
MQKLKIDKVVSINNKTMMNSARIIYQISTIICVLDATHWTQHIHTLPAHQYRLNSFPQIAININQCNRTQYESQISIHL